LKWTKSHQTALLFSTVLTNNLKIQTTRYDSNHTLQSNSILKNSLGELLSRSGRSVHYYPQNKATTCLTPCQLRPVLIPKYKLHSYIYQSLKNHQLGFRNLKSDEIEILTDNNEYIDIGTCGGNCRNSIQNNGFNIMRHIPNSLKQNKPRTITTCSNTQTIPLDILVRGKVT